MDNIDKVVALFESPLFDWIMRGGLIYLGVLWFAVALWVARDIVNRTNNVFTQVFFILMNIVLPVFGLILYLIIRPSKTLLEKYYEEMEYHFLADHSQKDEHCPRCEEPLTKDFLFCPSCAEQVKNNCDSCGQVYLSNYLVCPYCGKKDKPKENLKRKLKGKKKKAQQKAEVTEEEPVEA